jgi:hypothetical protein
MRNLTGTFSDIWSYDAAGTTGSSCRVTRTTVNPEDDTLYVLSEKKDDSGMVELEVLKAKTTGSIRSLQVSRFTQLSSLVALVAQFPDLSVDLHARSPCQQLLPYP